MKQFLTQLVTGKDNFTVDAFRVLAIAAVAVGLGLDVFVVVFRPTQVFDLQQFGIGFGTLLVAAAGALRLKSGTEPGTESSSVSVSSSTKETIVREQQP